MSTLEQAPARLELRTAMEARDLATAVSAFAPNAVIRSPITDLLTFQGRDQIAAILQVILDVFDDLHYTDELRDGDRAYLTSRARVDGTEIEIVDQIRFDENGKICEFTVFFRPMPAIAVAMRLIAAGLLARRSKFISTISSVLMRPLAGISDRRTVERRCDLAVGVFLPWNYGDSAFNLESRESRGSPPAERQLNALSP